MENNKFKIRKKRVGIYDDVFNTYVFAECPIGLDCLDVGCWTGKLGERLIREKRCRVDGVDMNKKALETAKNEGYRRIYPLDLNNPKDIKNLSKIINKRYDCIICADILEHLVNPLSVLKELKKLLKHEGIVIISVPNIAFISYRLLLLFGRFDYNPSGGVMDTGHLRFFTKKTLKELSIKAGYKITKIYGYNQVRKLFFFLKSLGVFFPELFSLQFLAVLSK